MTIRDRIADYLIRATAKSYRDSYCDDCLSAALDIPSEQVAQEARTLAEEGWFKRTMSPCESCGSIKPVSKRRISSFAA